MTTGAEFLLTFAIAVLGTITLFAFNEGVRPGFKALAVSALVLSLALWAVQ